MEMVRKVICLIAMVSVLSLPAIAGSQSESEIKDHGINYMDCQFDAGFTRGPTSEDASDDDSGFMLPPPLEFRNDEGSCGLSLPDSTEREVPPPPPESPRVPIPPEEKPGVEPSEEEVEEPEEPREEEPVDPIQEIPDSKFGGPSYGIKINKNSDDNNRNPSDPPGEEPPTQQTTGQGTCTLVYNTGTGAQNGPSIPGTPIGGENTQNTC